jgi:ubiquinone/menaquinone biosynthesis C-methylase UbiE
MESDEAAYKRRITGLYDRAAPTYGQVGPPFFQHVGRRLVELAGVSPGARVLDVATGRGAVLFAAAEATGHGGHVLGIDLAERMVAETSAEIGRRGLAHAAVRVMDAEQLDLPDAAFDAVLCSFAIFLFPSPQRCLLECRRVLRPGGVVGLGAADPVDPRWDWENELFRRHAPGLELPPAMRGRSLRRPGELVRELEAAGYADAREVREEASFAFRDADEWWDGLWTHGTRLPLESMSDEARARFETEGRAQIKELAATGGWPGGST